MNPSVTGQQVTFTATAAAAAPGSGTPTGNIEFLQGGVPVAACGGATGVAVGGTGQATCSVTYNATGTTAVTAVYLGDANYATSTSPVVNQVVNKASTLTALSSSVNPSKVGQSVTFTAIATPVSPGSGVPTGKIEFLQGGVPIAACGGATGVTVDGTGKATCAVTYNAIGTYAITATYLGDGNYTTSTSTPVSQAVGQTATTTSLGSSVNPSVTGQPVTFTATATPVAPGTGTPTGNIEFLQGGTPIAACGGATGVTVNGSGTATCAVTYAATGSYNITATYLGDTNYVTSTSSVVAQVVNKAATTTSLGSSVNPSVTGQSVTFTATATTTAPGTGTPTGNIEFRQGGTPIAACGGATGVAVNGSGTATCAVTFGAAGTSSITATYLGDTNYATSTSSPVSQVVNKASTTTTLASSVNPSVTGQQVTFTATVATTAPGSGTPTGKIEFLQGGNPIAACGGASGVAVNGSGTATCAVTYNASGTYAITATYLSDGNYATSTSSVLNQVVDQATTTTSLGSSVNPSVTGQPVTYTAVVAPVAPGTGTPTGTIEFLQGGVPVASCGGASGVAVDGTGTATCTVTYAGTGSTTVTAVYLGDANYVTSTSAPVTQVVDQATTLTTLGSSSNPSVTGQQVTYTAIAAPVAPGAGTPTGNIEFLDGATPIADCGGASGVTVDGTGTATCAVTYPAIGSHTITAVYLGDTNFAGSTSTPVVQAVDQGATATSLGSSANPSTAGDSVTYTAVAAPVAPATGTPTGNIEFLDGATPIADCGGASGVTVDGTGTAQCTTTYPVSGSHTITAVYLGDTNYSTSSSTPLTQVVDPIPTSVTASASPDTTVFGQSTTITADVPVGATGTVTFTGPGAVLLCTATVTAGQATCDTTALPVGTDTVDVAYSGDPTYGPSSTTTTVTVGQADTTTSLGSSADPSTAGDPVTYTSVVVPVAPGAGIPTGFVEFLDGGTPIADCGGAFGTPLDGTGTAQCTTTYPVMGTHTITAEYLGDTGFTASDSTPLVQVVDLIATSVTASASPDTTVSGQSTTITADVPVGATGTVTFTGPGDVVLCTATVTAGQATCDTSALPVGADTVTVAYSGDDTYGPSSTTTPVTVAQAATTTSLGSSANPSTAGDAVTFTGTVSVQAPGAGTPTANIEFLDGGVPIADCGGATGVPVDGGGTAQCTTTFPDGGDFAITAVYLGDTDLAGSTSTVLDQTVNLIPTSVTASASPDATVVGQSTTITAVLPAGATGTVTFTGPGDVVLCTATVTAGQATCDTSALPLGTDTVDVVYSGDATYAGSSTTTSVTVSQASTATTLGSSENPANIGDTVTYTATVTPLAPGSGTPTGNVEFLANGTPIAACGGATGVALDGSGSATCDQSYGSPGSIPIDATYLGDANYTGSSAATLTQVVSPDRSTTTASASPSATVFGQPTTITATVTPGATGTVTFTGPGDVVLCTATVSAGTATCDTSVLPVGTDTVTVAYSGDGTYGPSSTTTTVTVSRAATTTAVVSSANPSSAGDSVTYTATVGPVAPGAGTPTGFVRFTDDGTPVVACGGTFGVVLDGSAQATCAETYATAGSHAIVATYLGDTDFSGSTSSTLTQVVDHLASTTGASASPTSTVTGQPTTITATVTPGATGTVTFTGPGSVVLCTATITAGTATCTTTVLPVGTDTVTATYNGDGVYSPSSGTTTVTVTKASTTTALTSTPNPSNADGTVTFTATVTPVSPGSGTPTGNVEFLDGGTPIAACGGAAGVALSGGHAVCDAALATAGNHTITAVYLGGAGYDPSTSPPLTQVVDKAPTTIGVSVSPNPITGAPVTITATVSPGSPTGTVTFTGPGGVVLCTATVVSGRAVCVTTQLPAGTSTVTVAYSGDGSHLPSSTGVSITVTQAISPRGQGYWTDAADGGIFTFGNKHFYGSTGSLVLNAPAVGMASTQDDGGYWLVATDGGVFAFGDAGFYGSTGSIHLNQPIEGIAPTGDGKGYWMSASDGGIFAFGDATFHGSLGGLPLNKPIVGMSPTPDGNGYWLVASDGGVFAFGDAGFYGSAGAIHLNKPIVAMAATPDGRGYWLVATDGGIFAFGDAGFFGSTGSIHLNEPIVGIATSPTGNGYWIDASDGGVFSFGDTKFWGSMGGLPLNKPMVGMSI